MKLMKIFLIGFAFVSINAIAQNVNSSVSSEDALKVQKELYEPPPKIDAKSVQRVVYKTVFKKEMKESAPAAPTEEEE